jgi:hypothetical protein
MAAQMTPTMKLRFLKKDKNGGVILQQWWAEEICVAAILSASDMFKALTEEVGEWRAVPVVQE